MRGTVATAAVLLVAALGMTAYAGTQFVQMWEPDTVVPAPGFTVHHLSDYYAGVRETPADARVYIQEGAEPGGTIFILGGTHPNEPASSLSAILFLENARVKRGRLIVIPFANQMGFTHNAPQAGHPQGISFTLPDGETRSFRYGSRLTNPVYQWPNPDIYVHPASGQKLDGKERRNLNRCYPGVEGGALTERLAYAIMELIRKEDPVLAFDLHEASPEYPVVNAIVAHETSMELAAMVAMELEGLGIPMRLEPSPKNLRGLSHREWGDFTETNPILMETGNPSQGRLRGRTDEALVLTGADKAYMKAAELGRLYIPYDGDQPIRYRIARHVTSIMTFVQMLDMMYPDQGVTIDGIPGFEGMMDRGYGAFLNPTE
ncbi:MAG: succinylglutamate desuccinylase [Synergistales bacterium]|nr:succinylglutamate desuccinylase [Synergistales bacterium]